MKQYAIIFAVIVLSLQSCIKNDLPYPRIQANITYISAIDELRAANIDSVNRVATLYLPEYANIYMVQLDSLSLTPNTEVVSGNLREPLDLSEPYQLTLRMYQDYQWTIIGAQNIERNFRVAGQIGVSTIDAESQTVEAVVSAKTNIEDVVVEACKLGPSSSTMTPVLEGKHVDFSEPVAVSVENYGHKQDWTIIVTRAESAVETVRVDAWTNVAWVYGEAEADKHNTVQYRIKGDTEWLTVPEDWLTHDNGNFYARLTGLQSSTVYEARAVSDSQYGEELEFVTGTAAQMPNSDFDHWWLDGKVWCPWAQDGTPYWDTGNKGAATLGQSNSVPTDDTVDGHGQAAKLETKFIGIGFLGKLGAGNIFIGQYLRTEGTNGVLNFGRPFTERPTKLRGYCKYHSAPISSVATGMEDMKGQPDTCIVYCALVDLDEPLEIRTNPNNRQLFDPEAEYVIAYGQIQSGDDIDAYMPFEIELQYRATDRKPKYIICAGSASKYGDYFTGGNGSVLWLDDLELLYDY